jgi:hypothetical protein
VIYLFGPDQGSEARWNMQLLLHDQAEKYQPEARGMTRKGCRKFAVAGFSFESGEFDIVNWPC